METMTKSRIALIDDEHDYLDVMRMNLERHFEVMTYAEPEVALKAFELNLPDAVLLDIRFDNEDTDGFKVFEKIKTLSPDVPVFFLSCDSAASMISKGLITGGVDYFTKTISPVELITRLKARLETLKQKAPLKCRDIVMSDEAREVRVNAELINLTPKEYDILKVFMERQDQMLSKYDLKDILWKDVHVDVNNIDTHMFHIRRKFVGKTEGIECKKGVGYILRSKRA